MKVPGQGGPRPTTPAHTSPRAVRGRLGHRCASAHPVILSLMLLCWFTPAAAAQTADAMGDSTLQLRLHVAWGGGQARRWQGAIELVPGSVSRLQRLGLNSDEAAAIVQLKGQPDRITIDPASPRSYDGVEFSVSAGASSTLRVTLRSDHQPNHVRTIELRLADVLTGYHSEQLDETGNRILIRRAPGDRLRLKLDREHLIFDAGETWNLPIEPSGILSGTGLPLQLVVTLNSARSEDELWSDTRPVKLDETGTASELEPFQIPLPASEGVYELDIQLKRARLRDTIVGSKPLARRRVQFVVLAEQSPFAAASSDKTGEELGAGEIWRPVETWHPTRTNWTDWLAQIPTVPWLMPSFARQPLGNDKAVVRDSGGTTWTELAPGGWQAIPLPVDEVARPHLLEIEFPQDLPQSLGIRIVEPDAAGRVMDVGLDSGVQVPWSATLGKRPRGVHRMLFWPKSRTPLVVLINHDPRRVARFGQIRVLAGPQNLPPAPGNVAAKNERLAAVYFHKPFWPATFSATQRLDPTTGRSLDDWQTFYEAGTRLVQYMKHVGYNGAVLCVASEGSAVYPSRYLGATPKYDTGIYFTDGQDPIRKDVVELLMRLFARESLTLIPAIELSGALPEIEQLRRQEPPTGIVLSDGRGQWQGFEGDWKSRMPPYNPLDERVQTAIEHVFREIAERYDRHESFGGVAWLTGGQGVGLFPGPAWGRDPVTWQRFRSAFADERDATHPEEHPSELDWLQWRSRELLALQRRLQRVISRNHRSARLLVLTADLFAEDAAKEALRPDLLRPTDFRSQLLRFGLEPERYRNEDRIVLLEPRRLAPPFSPARFAISYQQRTPEWHALFGGYKSPGLLLFHEPIWQALPAFDRQSPFGSERTQLTVFSHLAPPEEFARARFVSAIVEQDLHLVLDGGWQLALGGEGQLQRLWRVWRQLPTKPFQTIPGAREGATRSSIVLRMARGEDETHVYLANAAPWSVTVTVQLQYDGAVQVQSLGPHPTPSPSTMSGEPVWQLRLEPFDLAAFRLDSSSVRVVSWKTTKTEVWGERIAEAVRTLRAQANTLRTPAPMATLQNSSFEQDGSEIPGWIVARGPGLNIRTDDSVSFDGKRSLHLRSSGNIAWVRSTRLPAPTTGRIFVVARLRTSDPTKQPPLRIAIDGRRNGLPYYRSARVGAGDAQVPKIDSDWGSQPFLLPITDLPVGGWQDFRVGFDLMGEGEVWIDDVRIYDVYFLVKERQELMLRIAVHESLAAQGKWPACYAFLQSYWPQLLFAQLEPLPARIAREPARPSAPAPQRQEPPTPSQEPRSILDRLKPKWPKRWYPF